jgi:acetylornithine deacetylase/succinyl-diaminopimelate desuccinylase-like protein
MKGAGVMHLMALLLARRQGLRLTRDIVFAAVPDEEAASTLGMLWLCEHRPDLVDVEFALSEGGSGQPDFAGRDAHLFGVATNEKEICWLRLTAVGKPGHGSLPHEDNSAVHLLRALVRLADWDRGITLTPEALAYVARLSEAGLLPAEDRAALEQTIATRPELLAAFSNTLNVTMVNAGVKANVIPARSSAVLDCRLLPGQSREDWRRAVEARIADPRIKVTFHEQTLSEAPTPVDWDTELYRVIESVVREAVEDAVVVPTMSVLGTDNRFLRRLGIPAYGFIPCLLSPEERAGFHGNNEFLAVENLRMGVELMYEIVRRMCT